MKRLSKSKKMSVILGASLLILAACAPDSQTRGGAAQPIPVERSTENSAASNANEAGAQTAPRVNSSAQPAAASAFGAVLASPLPTPTMPPQDAIEFTGAVEVMASDGWVVGGRTVAVTSATEIKPGLEIGMLAKVHAVRQADGSLLAREIEAVANGDQGNSNSNDNGNEDNGNHNGNVNSNDDNGNDNQGNVNSNGNNSNDDHGNVNTNDDNSNHDNNNGNVNANDDHGTGEPSGNSNDDHGGNGNDGYGNSH